MNASAQSSGVGLGSGCEFDAIVLGAGPVGQNVAARSRAAGLSVAVVERELVGGECSYWGCIPSKSLLRPVIAVADVCRIDGAREAIGGPIATAGVFGRRDRYVTNWDDSGQAAFVEGLDAALFRGHARLDGPRRVAVATAGDELVVLTARHAVAICTGSTATLPNIPGVAEAKPWTNRRATDSSSVPERLAVVGAGEWAWRWPRHGTASARR
jgi:dihydrolipoamide dehydrogenase